MNMSQKPEAFIFKSSKLWSRWTLWKENFNRYMLSFEKCNINQGKKIDVFLKLIGVEGVEIFNNFTFVNDVDRLNFDKLIMKFDAYCLSKADTVLDRYKFFSCLKEDLSVDEYLTKLNMLAVNCGFGDQESSLIRDRIFFSVQESNLKIKLEREYDLSLENTVDIIRKHENPEVNEENLRTGSSINEPVFNNPHISSKPSNNQFREESACSRHFDNTHSQRETVILNNVNLHQFKRYNPKNYSGKIRCNPRGYSNSADDNVYVNDIQQSHRDIFSINSQENSSNTEISCNKIQNDQNNYETVSTNSQENSYNAVISSNENQIVSNNSEMVSDKFNLQKNKSKDVSEDHLSITHEQKNESCSSMPSFSENSSFTSVNRDQDVHNVPPHSKAKLNESSFLSQHKTSTIMQSFSENSSYTLPHKDINTENVPTCSPSKSNQTKLLSHQDYVTCVTRQSSVENTSSSTKIVDQNENIVKNLNHSLILPEQRNEVFLSTQSLSENSSIQMSSNDEKSTVNMLEYNEMMPYNSMAHPQQGIESYDKAQLIEKRRSFTSLNRENQNSLSVSENVNNNSNFSPVLPYDTNVSCASTQSFSKQTVSTPDKEDHNTPCEPKYIRARSNQSLDHDCAQSQLASGNRNVSSSIPENQNNPPTGSFPPVEPGVLSYSQPSPRTGSLALRDNNIPIASKSVFCPYCNKKFSHNSVLKRHMPKHTRVKAFKCHYCEKSYTSQGALYNHEHTQHEHEAKRRKMQ